MPTLTWFGSVTNPRYFFCQLFVGFLSISDRGQERTVDRITYFHSLPRKWKQSRFSWKEAYGHFSTPHFSTATLWVSPALEAFGLLVIAFQREQMSSGSSLTPFSDAEAQNHRMVLFGRDILCSNFPDKSREPFFTFLPSAASPCPSTPEAFKGFTIITNHPEIWSSTAAMTLG